jgi:predicted transcriptional regulator of viral defense system
MSTRPKYQQEITSRINDYSKGIVFSAADFMDVADTDAINKTLSRLSEEGRIRRVVQGLYDVPEYSNLLQEYAVPRPDMVAEALARKFNWTIAPCGDTALNALHLSTQVPNVWSYVSDGPYRKYDLGNTKLSFKTVKQREISGFHRITVTVIQALRTLGKDNITEKEINILKRVLTEADKKIILKEGLNATAWIVRIIKEICREEEQ